MNRNNMVAKKIFIALPIYGGAHGVFFQSLVRFIQKPGINYELAFLCGDSLVSRARNNLVARFLKSDCTHLLFLDSDLEFAPDQITRLVNHGAEIVCGLYPKKQKELGWVINIFDGVNKGDSQGLLPVKCAGTGAMLIKRSVFEKMQDAYPQLKYDGDAGEEGHSKWDFFKVGVWPCAEVPRRKFPAVPVPDNYELDPGVEKGLLKMRQECRHLSEDWFFCYMAWNLGIPTFVDLKNVFYHWDGGTRYPLGEIPRDNLPSPATT